MSEVNPKIEESWLELLKAEFSKDYFLRLKDFLVKERKDYNVYPPGPKIFTAFNLTPVNKVKVVVIGQDPYHGDGQAHGLSFSVPKGVTIPPSLNNIYKELESDLGLAIPNHGFLEKWAKQGVLMLNATLSVRAKTPGSHQNKGWEEFTDAAIKKLVEQKSNLVFLLWGSYAQNKGAFIDQSKHLVLKAAHPSPFSAYRGFFGCKHFSKTNEYLAKNGQTPIDWQID